MVTSLDTDALLAAARNVQKNAYARFSSYRVGAAVLDESGTIHAGCNVENASYPEGICAEANAIGSMVAAGGKRIVAIAIVGGPDGATAQAAAAEVSACTPCGGCRQRIAEFADEHTVVLLCDDAGVRALGVDDLLPHAFRLDVAP